LQIDDPRSQSSIAAFAADAVITFPIEINAR
jgi:hypothetical protein